MSSIVLVALIPTSWNPSPPAPPPPTATPPSTCEKGTDPCTITCSTTGDASSATFTYSLDGFTEQIPTAKDYYSTQVTSSSGVFNYYYKACGPLLSTEVSCASGGLADPVALQGWGGFPPTLPKDRCAQLGAVSTQQCSMTFDAPATPGGAAPKPGLSCTYGQGYESRHVTIDYKCSEAYVEPAAHDLGNSAYLIELTGPAGCGLLPPPPGMSGGTLFLILLLVGIVCYFGGGSFLNFRYREKRGVQMVPQLDYWKQLPGLVKDGCLFTKEQAVKCYYYARTGGPPPLDDSLSARLAANEDGGNMDRS